MSGNHRTSPKKKKSKIEDDAANYDEAEEKSAPSATADDDDFTAGVDLIRDSIAGMKSPSAAATPSSADSNSCGEDDDGRFRFRPENLHNANPLNWEFSKFANNHPPESTKAVTDILRTVTSDEFTSGTVHASGLLYVMSYDQMQDEGNQSKLISSIMPELVELITKEGCDVNRLTKNDIQKLVDASMKHFRDDYNDNDKDTAEEKEGDNKEGSVYMKFIVMTVRNWINACGSILGGEAKKCSGPMRVFVTKLQSKLKVGIKKGWWKMNDDISIPYFGESSSRTFAQRMADKYHPLIHTFAEQTGAKLFQFKVASVNYQNSIQSRALESFVATLLSQCTMLSRMKTRNCQEFISCRCLTCDCTSFNQVICGDRIGYSSSSQRSGSTWKSNGYRIHEWNKANCNTFRNMPILQCPQRDLCVIAFVIQNELAICEYINNTPREKAWGLRVRENKDAPTGTRENRNHITVEDECRYFGWLVGNKVLTNEMGIHDPEWTLARMNAELDAMYEKVKIAYQDSENFHCGYFFPNEKALVSAFDKLRYETDYHTTREYRRSYFLSKDEDLEHLLYSDLFENARNMKWDTLKYGDRRDYMSNLNVDDKDGEVEVLAESSSDCDSDDSS